jgi:hypothetical protein
MVLGLMEGNVAVWAKVIDREAQARAIANGERNGEKDWGDFQTFSLINSGILTLLQLLSMF